MYIHSIGNLYIGRTTAAYEREASQFLTSTTMDEWFEWLIDGLLFNPLHIRHIHMV